MKKIMLLTSVLATGMLMGASSTTAVAPPGTDNIAAGYGAGYQSGGANQDVICFGTDAGMNSANNTRCVFIGKNAGKGVTGKTDWIDIGGKIVNKTYSTDTYIDISLTNGEFFGVHAWGKHCLTAGGAGEVTLCDHFNVDPSGKTTLFGRDVAVIGGPMSGTVQINGFVFQNGEFCVYTNGVKAGTLSFTPAN